jgi:hypothetical protein
MNFGPSNCFFKIQKFIGNPFGSVDLIPHILSRFQECECDSQVALSAQTFICPCLGHEPKAKVVIIIKKLFHFLDNFFFWFCYSLPNLFTFKICLRLQRLGGRGWGFVYIY